MLLCMGHEERRLHLYDVVSSEPPSLEEILDRIPDPVGETILHFTPDRIAPGAAAEPHLYGYGGPSYLMARGPFAAEGAAFALPRSART